MTAEQQRKARIPRAVWVLGGVSLLMDMSSELVHAVLPVYLTAVLGLSVLSVGIIEGIAEATASMMKLVSGTLSDRFASRKPLALLGYGLSALTKPVFPLAETAFGVVGARFVDRVGKGIRGAPRDAIVADVTPADQRDAAYGLRQALDTVGALIGPLLAMLLLVVFVDDLKAVLWAACIPALAAVLLLGFGLREPPRAAPRATRPRIAWASLKRFPPAFWGLLVVAALFALARLTEAFLVLRAQELGLTLAAIPLVMLVMSAAYAVSAYPAGLIGARFGRRVTLTSGLALLVLGYLALAAGGAGLWLGVALYGLHMGLTQGTLAAAVADAAPVALRATGFGVFHFTTGVFQLAAGGLGGWLWTAHGSASAFMLGAGAAVASALAAVAWVRTASAARS